MGVRRGFHYPLGTCLPTHCPASSALSPASRSSPRPGAVISPSPGAPRHCLPCSRISVGGRPMCCPPVRARFCPGLIRWLVAILLKDFAAALPSALPSVVIGQAANRRCSAHRMRFPPTPYQSTCSIVQRLTCRRLASSRWLTPFDRSTWMYSRCRSVRHGCRPEKRPSARAFAFAWPATVRSLIEFRHHSLKASTIESWSRPLAVDVSKSSDRDRNSTPILCRPSTTCSPQVSPVSGGDKVDRVGGRSLTLGG